MSPDTEIRKHAMGVLAKADEAALDGLWAIWPDKPAYDWLRRPETGLVMVRGRMGGTGAAFNLGEMTITRCAVRLAGGAAAGYAYVQGRAPRKAEIAALDDVFNVVTGTEAGAPLVAHEDVRQVTFTGSVATGTLVMQAAARNITRVTLELGGKSPVIVLADCDMEQALTGVIGAIYENAGQICSAGSRLVIERAIHDEFLERLVRRTKELTLGHGLRDPNVGPVNSQEQLDKIVDYVEGAKARGIYVAAGGARTADPQTGTGWFFEPTILDNVADDDVVIQEEIFGPVLAAQTIESVDEAIERANGTPFGLVAGLYIQDITKALRLARDIDAGQIYINEYFAGGIEVPFGSNKKSGFGREKGLEALRSYCKIKSVAAKI